MEEEMLWTVSKSENYGAFLSDKYSTFVFTIHFRTMIEKL